MSVANGAFTRTNDFSKGEDRIIPRFHVESILDQLASEREGRPIYREEERVELILPGNPHTKPVEKVTAQHRERWPEQYKRFKAGQEMALEGTPIEQWSVLSRGMVLELKGLDLHTVEQIAGMDDLACQRLKMAGQRLRTLAQAYLDDAKASAALSKATAENERKDQRIAELERKVDELSTLLTQTHAQLQDLKNAPSPVASFIPGMADPIEQAKTNPAPSGGSALDALAMPRKRGKGGS